MYKRQVLNYITIVCAVSTIGMAVYTIKSKKDIVLCTIMFVITIIFNIISNKCSMKDVELTKSDKELLTKLADKKGKSINFNKK